MRSLVMALVAGAALFSAGMSTGHAALSFPRDVDIGDTQNLVIDYVDTSSAWADLVTLRDGNLKVEVFGLRDLVLASTAALGSGFAVGIGNVNDGGTIGVFTVGNLAAGSHRFDLASSISDPDGTCGTTCLGTYAVRVSLTPIPTAAALLVPALGALGWLGHRRRARRASHDT